MKDFFIWVQIPVDVTVILPRTKKEKIIKINDKTTLYNILEKLSIKPDTCLTLVDNKPIPIDTIVKNNQTIQLIEVTSGG